MRMQEWLNERMLKHKKKGRKEKLETNTERRERKTDRRKKDRKKEKRKERNTDRKKQRRKKERKKERKNIITLVWLFIWKLSSISFLCNLWIFHTDTFGYDSSHRYKKFGNFQMVTYNEGRKCFIEWCTQHIIIYGYMGIRNMIMNTGCCYFMGYPCQLIGRDFFICTIPQTG